MEIDVVNKMMQQLESLNPQDGNFTFIFDGSEDKVIKL